MDDIKKLKEHFFTAIYKYNPADYLSVKYGEQIIDIDDENSFYSFDISINVYRRPEIYCVRKAVYWPADEASPAEYDIVGEVEFDIKKICVFYNGDLICKNLYPYLTENEIKDLKTHFNFDKWEWGEGNIYDEN